MTKQRKPIDPWMTAGPPGSWGRPGLDQGPRSAPDDLLERAMDALNGPRDTRFERLAARVSKMFEW
jgi:hypothetical protein